MAYQARASTFNAIQADRDMTITLADGDQVDVPTDSWIIYTAAGQFGSVVDDETFNYNFVAVA